MNDDATLYRKLRAETAELLGYSEPLSTAQSVKVDLVASLRLALDTFTAAQLAGEKVDTNKLLSAAEALERLLPKAASFNTEVVDSHTARAKLAALLDQLGEVQADDKVERIAALEAEVAELRATLAAKDSTIKVLSGGAASAVDAASPAPPAPPPPPPPQTSSQPPLPPRSPTNTPPAAYLARYDEPWRPHVGGGTSLPVPGSARSPRTW
jgi:uncharacterized small protein (DUF1192 family)